MTDDIKNQGTTSVVTETTTGTDLSTLTIEEEKVLRMAHGLSETDDHMLSFALGANEDTTAKLALMEQHLLTAFGWTEVEGFQVEESHVNAKLKIIEALKD